MKTNNHNSIITGSNVMTVFQGSGKRLSQTVKGLLGPVAAVLLLTGLTVTTFAQSKTYRVDDEIELQNALAETGYPDKTIVFERSIGVQNPQLYTLQGGDSITLQLKGYTLQGNGHLEFNTNGGRATLIVEGSTMDFNDGVKLHGEIDFVYKGIYTSGNDDYIGENVGDDIKVDLTTIGSGWDAFNHDVVVGHDGQGEFVISNGNWGKSENLIIGNHLGGVGQFDISGVGTVWTNTENTIVGVDGDGHFKLYDGAIFNTGNFAVNSTSAGLAEIWGEGTILNIFGSNTAASLTPTGTDNMMAVTDRAQVYLNYNDGLDNGTLKGDAYLTLGGGTSTFDNAYFHIDRGNINGPTNAMTFTNLAMFEGSTYGVTKNAPSSWGPFGSHGTIALDSLTFDNGGLFSPGYGSHLLWDRNAPLDFSQNGMVEMYYLGKDADPFDDNGDRYVDAHGNPLPVGRYGQIDYNGDFNLNQGGIAILDFDIEGAENHALIGSGAETLQHKDYVSVSGTATLDGHIHFRPMTGYYQDDVAILFMDAATFAGNPNVQLTQWPSCWFENPEINNGVLEMTRHQTPFNSSGESFNERSVGVALDVIYNERQAMNVDELMLTQEQDDWFPVLDWFWGMNDEDFRMAMRQLAGESRVSSFYMPIRSPWRYGFDRTNWRKSDNHIYFGQQNVNKAVTAKNNLWVTPYYDYQHMENDGNINGANISRVSFMAGYDRALTHYSAVGFLFGYSQPKMDQGSSRVVADDYLFALHGSARVFDDYELKAWGSYGSQNYRLSRHVPIGNGEDVHARYSGNSWTGSIQLARPFHHRQGVIRPLVAVDYSYVEQSGATENGYYPIALRYSDSDWSQLFARAGVRADYGWSRLNFTGSVTYSYLIDGDAAPTCTNQFLIGGPEFNIQGNNLSRSFVNVGLGTQLYLNRRQSRMLFVQYNGVYGDNMNSQNASLGYQMTF